MKIEAGRGGQKISKEQHFFSEAPLEFERPLKINMFSSYDAIKPGQARRKSQQSIERPLS